MKVLYFHQHFSSPNGSTGIRSYGMSRCLTAAHEVTMVCGSYLGSNTGLTEPFVNGERRGLVDGIQVIEFELDYANSDGFLKRVSTFMSYVYKGLKLIFTEQYDLVFATTTPLTAGIPGIVARWVRNKPFVFEVRDLWPELPKAMGVITNPIILGLMSMLEWLSYRSAHHVIALSPGIADGIAKQGLTRDKITLVPNGCDLDIFDAPSQAWRPEGINESDLLVLFAGTHGVANGLDSVLDAAGELISRGRLDVKILLMGQGKEKPHLMRRAADEKLDNVIFHDPVNKKKLAGLMSAADLGLQILANVSVFYYGTSPNKFFDYISASLPVLNNYPGWLSDMISDHDCGFAIPPDNPIAFADALETAAEDRSRLKTMGANSRRLAVEQFDREVLAQQWVRVLEMVYKQTNRGRYE